MSVPDADLDRLFSLPLEEFVGERKRLSRALAQAGRRDDARALDKLPRPSVSAWVVNQVARREPGLVKRLGELTERLRGAQGRTASGGGDDFAAMTAEHRQTLGALRELADEVLSTSGHGASPQLLRRVITNLRAGVAEPDTRPLVEQGRLGRDVEEADFTTLFEALPPSAGGAAGDRDKDHDDDSNERAQPQGRRVSPLRGTAAAARTAATPKATKDPAAAARDDATAAARMAAERAQRDAERAREKARAAAERRLVRLREAAATARASLVAEERTVAAARGALAAKEEHLARVRAASDEAAAAVAAVEEELKQLR